jgi:hypothetical protein
MTGSLESFRVCHSGAARGLSFLLGLQPRYQCPGMDIPQAHALLLEPGGMP